MDVEENCGGRDRSKKYQLLFLAGSPTPFRYGRLMLYSCFFFATADRPTTVSHRDRVRGFYKIHDIETAALQGDFSGRALVVRVA